MNKDALQQILTSHNLVYTSIRRTSNPPRRAQGAQFAVVIRNPQISKYELRRCLDAITQITVVTINQRTYAEKGARRPGRPAAGSIPEPATIQGITLTAYIRPAQISQRKPSPTVSSGSAIKVLSATDLDTIEYLDTDTRAALLASLKAEKASILSIKGELFLLDLSKGTRDLRLVPLKSTRYYTNFGLFYQTNGTHGTKRNHRLTSK